MFRHSKSALIAISSLALAAGAAPALAQTVDAADFLDRLAQSYAPLGVELAFTGGSLSGTDVVVDEMSVTIEATTEAPAMGPFTITGPLTFANVTADADGAYFADSLTLPAFESVIEEEDSTGSFAMGETLLTGLYVPAGDLTTGDTLLLLESFETGDLSLVVEDVEVMAVDTFSAVVTFDPPIGEGETTALTSDMTIDGISFDLSAVEGEEGATIAALGLESVTGSITQTFSWDLTDGRLIMDEFNFDFAELGALDINLDLVGLTPALLDEINTMNEAVEAAVAAGDAEAVEQQQMLMGMQLMQGLSIAGASVRYHDASLANTLIDFNAEQAGVSREDMIAGFKQVIPAMLAESPIPALNDTIVAALSAFLDDPQSLEVTVAPDSPMNVLVVMGAAANPASLVDLLGLGITANE